MGENSKIEWTDHTLARHCVFLAAALRLRNWLQVNFLVAVLAKGNPVAEFITKFWEFSESLDVMRLQIATALIAAMLAGVGVAGKNSSAPFGVFNRSALAQVSLMLAVGISVMIFTAWRSLACDLAYSRFRLGCVRLPRAIRSSQFCRYAHLKLRFRCVGLPFECRRFAFHVLPDLYAAALMTLRVKAIVPCAIFAEVAAGLPRLAFRAAFQTLGNQSQELFKRDSRLLC